MIKDRTKEYSAFLYGASGKTISCNAGPCDGEGAYIRKADLIRQANENGYCFEGPFGYAIQQVHFKLEQDGTGIGYEDKVTFSFDEFFKAGKPQGIMIKVTEHFEPVNIQTQSEEVNSSTSPIRRSLAQMETRQAIPYSDFRGYH
ncbi:MAG: hypothetical protein AABX85_03465 [Nanoarchaeota archaeon]